MLQTLCPSQKLPNIFSGRAQVSNLLPDYYWNNKSPVGNCGGADCITEIICFQFPRCKNYVTAPDIDSPRGHNAVQTSLKSPVRITAPKNNSEIISLNVIFTLRRPKLIVQNKVLSCNSFGKDGRWPMPGSSVWTSLLAIVEQFISWKTTAIGTEWLVSN